jgi:hypothetical protein
MGHDENRTASSSATGETSQTAPVGGFGRTKRFAFLARLTAISIFFEINP